MRLNLMSKRLVIIAITVLLYGPTQAMPQAGQLDVSFALPPKILS
jgi:hypothetical protein